MLTTKTFRVPRRVRDQASYGLSEVASLTGAPPEAFQVANYLLSGESVGPAVLNAINRYFFDHQRKPLTDPVAKMYGGKPGREWASRCIAAMPGAVTAAAEPLDRPAFDLNDDEVESILEWSRAMMAKDRGESSEPEAEATEPEAEEASVEELATDEEVAPNLDEPAPDQPEEVEEVESSDPVDELGEHVETALGLATQLDETIEKLADALDEALEETEEPVDPETEAAEMSMVQDALAEVGADLDDMDADFAVMAAEARERVAAVALARERSKAMAKMASARMTFADEGAGPVAEAIAEKVADAPADADPKAPGSDHHAARQVRDWHGRFAKVGGRVRSKAGNLGYIKKVDDQGQLVIEDDDGQQHTVDPKEVEIITKKSPARLPEPKPLIEDPKARLDAYLAWAKDQMGVAGE